MKYKIKDRIFVKNFTHNPEELVEFEVDEVHISDIDGDCCEIGGDHYWMKIVDPITGELEKSAWLFNDNGSADVWGSSIIAKVFKGN